MLYAHAHTHAHIHAHTHTLLPPTKYIESLIFFISSVKKSLLGDK
jgi:hypothetical protein